MKQGEGREGRGRYAHIDGIASGGLWLGDNWAENEGSAY
jgi:hypothetical protein